MASKSYAELRDELAETQRTFLETAKTNLLSGAAIDLLAKRCDELERIVATLKRAK